jgi:hypothetical protein
MTSLINDILSLIESATYRLGSEAWLNLINEARANNITLPEKYQFILENTDAGKKGMYQGKEVNLDVPFKTPGHPRKKYGVYTLNEQGKVVIVRFGDPEPRRNVKNHDPERARLFLLRHKCNEPGPKWKAKWWSCNVGNYAKELDLQSDAPW